MIKIRAKLRDFATHSLFGAFFLTMFGWGMLHAGCILMRASTMVHLVVAVPAVILIVVILYRYRQHWPIDNGRFSEQRRALGGHWNPRALFSYLLLVGFGAAVGGLVSAGSVFLLLLMAIGTMSVPWAKFSVCVHHFFLSSLTLVVGAVSGIALVHGSAHPMHFLLAAWVVWAVACAAVLFAIFTHGNRRDRMPSSGSFA